VQLRFGVADGTSQHLSDFVVLVSFDVVQHKRHSVSRGQTFDGPLQVDTIDRCGKNSVMDADFPACSFFVVWRQRFLQRYQVQTPLAQRHQDHVHTQTVKPGRERGLASKSSDLAVHLQEGLLREILRVGYTPGHTQA